MQKWKWSLPGIFMSFLILVSCNPDPEPLSSETLSDQDSIKEDTNLYVYEIFDTVIVLEKKLVKQLKKKLPDYDKTKFDEVTVDFFFRLAHGTNGKAYFAENASKVKDAILEVLKTHVKSGTDVLFLIDKTGSMSDDILKVRQSVETFVDVLSEMKNVRAGMAFYGDKHVDDPWYDQVGFSRDFDSLKYLLEWIHVTGGGDTPESVNDAIYKSVKAYNWQSNHNKIILVLGDAPSLKPPYSDHSEKQVIDLCNKYGVKVNLYPVIIGIGFSSEDDEWDDTEFEDKSIVANEDEAKPDESFEVKVYPNPVNRSCAVEMKDWGQYDIAVYDMTGNRVFSKTIDDYQLRIDFSRQANAYYIIRVYDKTRKITKEQKVLVQH